MRPLEILHVITTLDVGGAEMHLLSQVRGQCARGHRVRVVYLKGKGTLREDFLAAGADEVGLLPSLPGMPFALASLVRGRDIVHSHLLKADMVTALVTTLAGRRAHLVASKHNDEQVLQRPLVSRVHGVLGNLPRRTIVLSDHVGRFIQRHGRVREADLRRIYYGLDRTPFEAAAADRAAALAARTELGIGEEEVVFTCVARFAAQKAHDVLIRAFHSARHALEGRRELRLLLVGDDPFGDGRQRAEALARELGLTDTSGRGPVLFAGIRRDVPRLLAASDVFVMSSLWEGLGLVFLEAMATGLPVLSSRVSAIPEVVVEGETGLLVPPGDSAELGQAMERLAGDEELRGELGRSGHQRVVEHFNLDRMVDETLEVYRETLEGRS